MFLAAGVGLLASHAQAEDPAALVKGLGSKSFKEREVTQQRIMRVLDDPSVVEAIHRPSEDPEIEQRLSVLRERYIDRLKPFSLPHMPWVDMLPKTGYPNASEIEARFLALSGGHGRGPIWEGDIYATRLFVKDLIAQKKPSSEIRAVLMSMEDVQRRSTWWEAYAKAMGLSE